MYLLQALFHFYVLSSELLLHFFRFWSNFELIFFVCISTCRCWLGDRKDIQFVKRTATTISKSLFLGTCLMWSYCWKTDQLTKTEWVWLWLWQCVFVFTYVKVLFRFLSFCIAAIRQAISKALVAYYQKCKYNILNIKISRFPCW